MDPTYLIRAATDPHGPVEIWSEARLPFEPRGEVATMRDDLRVAVARLRASSDEILHGAYMSDATRAVDAENVLFYNVGAGSFRASSHAGVRFERLFAPCPRPPGAIGFRPLHYARYSVVPRQERFTAWTAASVVARWRQARIPPMNELVRPSAVWLGMKRAAVEAVGSPPDVNAPFGLRVVVTRGAGGTNNPMAMLKPLLDGIVAAFHCHDGQDLDVLSHRLGLQLRIPAHEAARLLRDESGAVLGRRRLLWSWGDSVQWNPADDACAAAEVVLADAGDPRIEWSHSGELLRVVPIGNREGTREHSR